APRREDPEIRSPLAGTLYFSPSPGEADFVTVGQVVEVGATLCVIEAMKVFNEVKAERAGTVEALLVTSGDDVDAGQPILRVA
ncbi:hypothetical protein N825_29530, partial [Skermanella stibiiresistens SB22]